MNEWKQWPIKRVELGSDTYPTKLNSIKQKPKQLYYRGDWSALLFNKTISIVGSRRMTTYGKIVLEKLLPDLVAQGLTIISGFMYGIDSEAHKQCVALGGKTIAVLGGGLDYLLPSENDNLYTRILETGGLVISEYEPNFKPTLWSFPQRNRIVSGLSTQGVLIIEARLNSGSLVTARIADTQGKKVFAVPGPVTSSQSAGNHWLIQNNKAMLVTCSNDILDKDEASSGDQLSLWTDYNQEELIIAKALEDEALSLDDLVKIIKKDVVSLGSTLGLMTLKGWIVESQGMFRLTKK